jgi:rubrerythrin
VKFQERFGDPSGAWCWLCLLVWSTLYAMKVHYSALSPGRPWIRAGLGAGCTERMMFTLVEVLDLAIRLEINGEKFYRRFMDSMLNPELRAILLWLADQEHKHAAFFTRLKGEEWARAPADLSQSPEGLLLQDFLGDRALSLDEVDAASLQSVQDILQCALEFERDTILFYDMIKAFITEKAVLERLGLILQEENAHIHILQDMLAGKTRAI